MRNFSPEEKFIIDKLKSSLAEDLTYHGLHHTLSVFNAAIKIGKQENINKEEMRLLRIASLYHDAGFIITYKDHEKAGCRLAKNDLPQFGYTSNQLKIICDIIMATKLPQKPKTQLEKIICDADLDYLGGKDFDKISNWLFCEMKTYLNLHDEIKWNELQKNFLKNHHYFTEYGIKKLEPVKQKHLQKINKIVAGYHARKL